MQQTIIQVVFKSSLAKYHSFLKLASEKLISIISPRNGLRTVVIEGSDMSAIGVGHVEEKWRVTLAASVLNGLQLRKKDRLIFYFDFDSSSEGQGARLVALSFPLTTSCFQGETRGSQDEISLLIKRLAPIGKLEELFIRRGRTNEYSMNYVISVPDQDCETTLKDALISIGKPIYNQRLTHLGEGGKIGEAIFKPLLGRASFETNIDEKNRIWIPADLDNDIVEKLGLTTARFSIQTVDPSTGRLIMIFTPTEKLVDLSFLVTELGQNDLADLIGSLNIFHLTPQALLKKATSSPIKCRVRMILDYTHTQLGIFPESATQTLKQTFDKELKSPVNKIIREMQEKRGEEPRDVVVDIELSVPLHDE